MKSIVKAVFTALLYIFAAIGFFLTAGYTAVRFGLTNETGIVDLQRESFLDSTNHEDVLLAWSTGEEWTILDKAIRRDEDVIKKAAKDAGVSPRLILASLVSEQLRLFFTEREAYKQFFYPLKILGPQTQFSWGVMGMKEETAIPVEQHLKDSTSPFYLGSAYENILNMPATTTDIKTARFVRMTDQHNHYWSYLYAGLYMKQIMAQWKNAGFPIDTRVDIITTLYNIGFVHSEPKANPQVGGAEVEIAGVNYSFGSLGQDFYDSELLTDIFPRP